MLQKPKASGRLFKWVIELGQFDMNFRSRTTIKRQALANFIAEFTYANTTEVVGTTNRAEAAKVVKAREKENSTPTQDDTQQWTLYVDDVSNENGSRAGMILINPE